MKKLLSLIWLLAFFTFGYSQTLTPIARTGDIKDSLSTYTINILKPTINDSLEVVRTELTNAVGSVDLTTLSSGSMFVGNASNEATAVTISGSIGITNEGITSITDDSIVNADINSSAGIDASKLADGSVSNTEFQYLDNVTSSVQTQLNTMTSNINSNTLLINDVYKLPFSISYPQTDEIIPFYLSSSITIDSVKASILEGTSVVFNIYHDVIYKTSGANQLFTSNITNNIQATSSGVVYTVFNDATILSNEMVWLKCITVNGTVTNFILTIYYSKT